MIIRNCFKDAVISFLILNHSSHSFPPLPLPQFHQTNSFFLLYHLFIQVSSCQSFLQKSSQSSFYTLIHWLVYFTDHSNSLQTHEAKESIFFLFLFSQCSICIIVSYYQKGGGKTNLLLLKYKCPFSLWFCLFGIFSSTDVILQQTLSLTESEKIKPLL